MVACKADELRQDAPGLAFSPGQLYGVDEGVDKRGVPDLDETAQVKDRIAVDVAQARQARQHLVGDEDELVAVLPGLLHRRAHREQLLRRQEDRLAPRREDAHRLLLDLDPVDLVVVGALLDARQISRDLIDDRCGSRLEQDRLHPVLVRGPADVRALAVERALELRRRGGDVVREEELLLDGDAHTFDVDARGLALAALQDRAEVGAL